MKDYLRTLGSLGIGVLFAIAFCLAMVPFMIPAALVAIFGSGNWVSMVAFILLALWGAATYAHILALLWEHSERKHP